ncbi:hypothetical protein BAG01nite_40570 [Brevibacillus agri]|uniref:TIGR02452 family protein n=1 Tax=Brevibacillus agri TaxID=51101 RepID=A0A3M8AKB5_9BACL|nr:MULTISPECIES: TIGR02452 family protein [Brevibacillus]ELK41140.1 nicotinamide mononucleotide adenylyltransferase/ribosylnicotinamide kinase [Brevibacillus agri BAB-2500]MDN4093196.1 TIGR02452 family protein [Brevibacillus agri]QAV15042.1 TIGR02452 family protein [Brevibacillus agri]QHZ57713.1 TIGR02452 family protein [Brevibacillus sp. NSP2.1]RNB51638.1 TIGR02452 family protein [Brevibacillus agri]
MNPGNNRDRRSKTAHETLGLLDQGFYVNRRGEKVSFAAEQSAAIRHSRLYRPDDLGAESLPMPARAGRAKIQVTAESSLGAAERLIVREQRENTVCLNFASAKHPGGGFPGGSQAQEESLARASGLLDQPYLLSFVTAPAVNAGVVREREPENAGQIGPVMKERIRKVLRASAIHGNRTVILGAYGCGVFRNQAKDVADYFAQVLLDEEYAKLFDDIVFAIYDHSARQENVRVVAVEDRADSDETYDWEAGAADIKRKIGRPIDLVFSSEPSYDPIFRRLYPGAKHVVLDGARSQVPISATQIRSEGVFAHWQHIPAVVRPSFVKKVVVVGTESCGKSTLPRYLAKMYNTVFVEEYGRTICEEVGGCDTILTKEYFPHIAYAHKMKEYEAGKQANKLLFIDTEAVVTQFYSELYTGHSFPVLDEIAREQQYDLWLLLEPDVAWVDDGLRVHGAEQVRWDNHEKLCRMLDERGISYVTITGDYAQRLTAAMQHVNQLL